MVNNFEIKKYIFFIQKYTYSTKYLIFTKNWPKALLYHNPLLAELLYGAIVLFEKCPGCRIDASLHEGRYEWPLAFGGEEANYIYGDT